MRLSGFSAEFERFVASRIESVEQLKILLLLRSEPMSAWTPLRVAEELKVHPALAWGWMATLHARKLVKDAGENGEAFSYGPETDADARMVDELVHANAERPVALSSLIARHSANELQAFSDAFDFRKRDR
jgi:hypothetical protein